MIKILQVLPSLNVCGGVENYLMNYYSHIDDTEVVFDFAVHDLTDDFFKDKIEARGGKIFVLPKFTLGDFKNIAKRVDEVLINGGYDIIHCHQANAAFLYLKRAKKLGVKCRILHSHQAKAADKLTHQIRNKPLLYLGKKHTTHNFACSKLAGEYLYKKKPYTVINNAISIDKFTFNADFRAEIRGKYGIPEDAFVIGNIGRMCPQKNQAFALEIFSEVLKAKANAFMLIVGDGELNAELNEKAKRLGVSDRVIFAGTSTETYKFYSAFDVFLLPSLYEGLPVVGIEAQTSGLPVITSTTVTRELKVLDTTEYIALSEKPSVWANAVVNASAGERRSSAQKVAEAGYDIIREAKRLAELYRSCVK